MCLTRVKQVSGSCAIKLAARLVATLCLGVFFSLLLNSSIQLSPISLLHSAQSCSEALGSSGQHRSQRYHLELEHVVRQDSPLVIDQD